MTDPNEPPGSIETEAAEWVVQLGSSRFAETDRAELAAWRRQSAAHDAAFQRASRTWSDLARLKPGNNPVAPRADRPIGSRGSSRWVWPAAASLLLALLLGAFYAGDPVTLLTADYRTAPGEIRTVTLADGSAVQLNTESAIAVQFDGRERRVRLLAGEAAFSVTDTADAQGRPFIVAAEGGAARALGTRFAVRRNGEAVTVTVLEHRVEVSFTPDGRSEPASVAVSPGQSVSYDSRSGLRRVTAVDADRVLSWQRNRLIFDRVPLADAVAELNRYRRGRIVIADAALARRTVSGVFRLDDLDGALDTIAVELAARTASVPPFLTVLY